jgi:hypothetical protein
MIGLPYGNWTMKPNDEANQAVRNEGFMEEPDEDIMVDDPDRIAQYRAVGLAEGLQEGTSEDVLRAWQWLSNHPDFTNRLEEWFQFRVAELKEMGRIK